MKNLFSTILFLFIYLLGYTQNFELPEIPAYDSTKVDQYKDKILEKQFFKNGKKVFEIGYNSGSMLYTPFAHIGGGKEDSCYAYFDNENYDFYKLGKGYVIHEKFAENDLNYAYHKFDLNGKTIEKGNSYFVKRLSNQNIIHNHRYKIGKWIQEKSERYPYSSIDYDRLMIDGEQIYFKGNKAIINSLIKKAEQKIKAVYGNNFFNKYIRLNIARSTFMDKIHKRPEQPSGFPLLINNDVEIDKVDLVFDILIDDYRFGAIMFRISQAGDFFGKTHFSSFSKKDYYLTKGLDKRNKGDFHTNIKNWKKVANAEGFNIRSKEFNVRFRYIPKEDMDGKLYLILEESVKVRKSKTSFTRQLKQLYINPWTGKKTWKKKVTGEASESSTF